ncbi:MAG: hypothetical protein KKG67_20365 [Gammaproteobacteria bacterium]|nr:hypothetical protein [Gammaproteobacteria bacterium]
MATDLKLVSRIRGARDEVLKQIYSHDMPVKVSLHPAWIDRFKGLYDDRLVVPTTTHSGGVRFNGLEVEDAEDESVATVAFADGTVKSFDLGAP